MIKIADTSRRGKSFNYLYLEPNKLYVVVDVNNGASEYRRGCIVGLEITPGDEILLRTFGIRTACSETGWRNTSPCCYTRFRLLQDDEELVLVAQL